MSDISSVVVVNIVVQDASVSQTGFGTPMILTHEDFFSPNLVQSFSDTASMVTAGASATGPTVLAATAMFAQSPRPPLIKIGKRTSAPTSQTKVVTVAVNVLGATYTTTINGVPFTAVGLATAVLTAGALFTSINAGSEPVTATDNLDGTYDLVEDVAGVLFGLSVAPVFPDNRFQTVQETTTDAGIAADYAAIKVEDNDFYGVMTTSDSELEINILATAVGADKKIFITQSANQDILDDTAGNLGEDLNAAAHDRTALIWSGDTFDFAAGAWLGKQLPTVPGSSTWKFKTLTGVTVDDLGTTEISNLDSNKANHYTPVGGINITREGTMASGRFIDVTRGVDWLDSRISEEVFALLVNNQKIKFTDSGITQIQGAIEGVLAQGITNDLLAADPAPVVTVPKASAVSAADKAARTLTGVAFSATLAGAIHDVTINGTVSV
ncbi:hypothetical protein LCGC14_1095080 [marine sediment metagenome]|uniref:Uncharacterized protein n=1 Tax=marine sediment metagenome TaxID=412755 RepID=A0A0F9MB78_9ZZZZ